VHRYPSNRADASRIFCRSSQMWFKVLPNRFSYTFPWGHRRMGTEVWSFGDSKFGLKHIKKRIWNVSPSGHDIGSTKRTKGRVQAWPVSKLTWRDVMSFRKLTISKISVM
jgi:hypothetical protein